MIWIILWLAEIVIQFRYTKISAWLYSVCISSQKQGRTAILTTCDATLRSSRTCLSLLEVFLFTVFLLPVFYRGHWSSSPNKSSIYPENQAVEIVLSWPIMIMRKGGRRNQLKMEFLGEDSVCYIHIVGLTKLEGKVCIVAGNIKVPYRCL